TPPSSPSYPSTTLFRSEFARTQHGNNNAYCQDSEIGWIDWNISEESQELLSFVRKLVRLRQRFPMLRRNRFLVGAYNEELGVKDVTWLAPNAEEISIEQWHDVNNRCMGMLLDGRAQPTGIRRAGSDATLLIILSAHHEQIDFTLPEVPQGIYWNRLVDTSNP